MCDIESLSQKILFASSRCIVYGIVWRTYLFLFRMILILCGVVSLTASDAVALALAIAFRRDGKMGRDIQDGESG